MEQYYEVVKSYSTVLFSERWLDFWVSKVLSLSSFFFFSPFCSYSYFFITPTRVEKRWLMALPLVLLIIQPNFSFFEKDNNSLLDLITREYFLKNINSSKPRMCEMLTGYASRAQGASTVRMHRMAKTRSSGVPFLRSSINFFIQ